jgi:hypothetical protein
VRLTLSIVLVACGDDGDGSSTPEHAATETEKETAPLSGDHETDEETPEGELPDSADSADEDGAPVVAGPPPALDSAEAIAAALRGRADSAPALWALVDPVRGLDLDFNWVSTHFVHTACSEAELATWMGWARDDDLSTYRLSPGDPFHCTADLSLCASCPEDISGCQHGYAFELAVDDAGRRALYGIIAAPARADALWDLQPTTLEAVRRARVDLGAQAESGVKCRVGAALALGDVESLWVEDVPLSGARSASELEGEEAASFVRDLADRFGLDSHCVADHCVVPDEVDTYGVYFTQRRARRGRPPPPLRFTLVTRGPPECDWCAPLPSADVMRRARRTARARRRSR